MTTDNNVYPSSVTYYPRGEMLMGPNLSLKEVLQVVSTASTNLVGKDLVLNGFDVTFTYNEDSIDFKVSPGYAVIDEVLIQSSEETTVTLDSFAGLQNDGKFVVVLKFQTYIVQEEMTFDQLKVSVNYVTPEGLTAYAWDKEKDRVVLDIFDHVMSEGKLVSLISTTEKDILIHDKTYWKNGYDFENSMNLSKYIQAYLDNIEMSELNENLILEVLAREKVITEDILEAKDYQNSGEVNAIIDARNLLSLANMQTYLSNNKYVTENDLVSRGYATLTNVNNIIDSKDYQTFNEVTDIINTTLTESHYMTQTDVENITNNIVNNYIVDGDYLTLEDLETVLDNKTFLTEDNIRDVVSELVNPILDDALDSKNYLTTADLDARDYATETRVNELLAYYIVTDGYVTGNEVNTIIDSKNFVTEGDVETLIGSKNYASFTDIAEFIPRSQISQMINDGDFVSWPDFDAELELLYATDAEIQTKFCSTW